MSVKRQNLRRIVPNGKVTQNLTKKVQIDDTKLRPLIFEGKIQKLCNFANYKEKIVFITEI